MHVRAVQSSDGNWTFHVTVEHPDTGWEDYADGWDVLAPDDEVLRPDPDSPFTRLLLHPHENEQPFTRSQAGIVIPSGVSRVRVRAHDLVDGYGGREVWVDLTVASGEDSKWRRCRSGRARRRPRSSDTPNRSREFLTEFANCGIMRSRQPYPERHSRVGWNPEHDT